METCPICENPITIDRGEVHENGLKTLVDISEELHDGVAGRFAEKTLPIPVHATCRRHYTKPSTIRSKRKRQEDSEDVGDNRKSIRRSETPTFDFKSNCLYCGMEIITDSKHPNHITIHEAETMKLIDSVKEKCNQRRDEWSDIVRLRTENCGDLIAPEAKYHHECQVRFHASRMLEGSVKGRPHGATDDKKHAAFLKLCEYLNKNDEYQYSIGELMTLMEGFLDGDASYTQRHLKQKLEEYYGNEMIITKEHSKDTIYTFLDTGNRILRSNYQKLGLSKDNIIDMAATLIEDDIRMMVCDMSSYPKFSEMDQCDSVPLLLSRLLTRIITSKSRVQNTTERRRIAIAHSIIQAVRPRSFISPILLAIAVYVNTKLESRELVDVLSSLSFADDYREVMRLHDSLLPTEEDSLQLVGDLINFIFDNADVNVRTLTGRDTWHALGGIACMATPPGNVPDEPIIPRCIKVRSALVHGRFSQIPIHTYKKKTGSGLKNAFIGPLKPQDPLPPVLQLANKLDTLWLSSFCLLRPLAAKCSNWTGFMQASVRGELKDKSQIIILPFINLDSSKPETLYSALCFAQSLLHNDRHMENANEPGSDVRKIHATVTFDQPLYAKADEIVQASPELSSIIVRLGGFHLAMSYMGSIGFIMKGSGIEDLWETVYAPNSIEHMITGHAYARALRSHFLTSAALTALMLQISDSLDDIDVSRLLEVHNALLEGTCSTSSVLHEGDIQKLSESLDLIASKFSAQSRTGQLWINYLSLTHILRIFIYAERTGQWDLHLYAITNMIPIFHAAGHLAYARSARRYCDVMNKLPDVMDHDQFQKLTTDGYFTIRRSDKLWSGNFTDQTIEQELMRMIKVPGGLSHGRGITPATQAKLVHVLPKCIPICNALEDLCGVHTQTSDQHYDLRASTTVRDGKDLETYLNWLKSHSPFAFEEVDGLVSIANGVVAASSANADEAFTIGQSAADAITGIKYADVHLKRKDRVVSIAMSRNAIVVRGQEVELNPTLLFMRVTCVMTNPTEIAGYLEFEFSKQAPALFDKHMMRKNAKSVLAHLLMKPVTPSENAPSDSHYVIDGGYLLHSVPWSKECNYGAVCDNYVNHVIRKYGTNTSVVFDGYTNTSSNTKTSEQDRRASRVTSPDIVVNLDAPVSVKQNAFLNNRKNKTQLIDFLKNTFEQKHITCYQSNGDADTLICSTAITRAHSNQPVVLVGNDTDLMVILTHSVTDELNISMQVSTNPNTMYSISEIQKALSLNLRSHILVAHAITGCDTVSAPYNIGKQKVISMLDDKREDWSCLNVFKQKDASHDDIAQGGERLLLKLYGAKTATTLDKQRHLSYMQKVSRKSVTSDGFQLKLLPPTSAAAKYHSYRTYHAVQDWLGNSDVRATEWGWELTEGVLSPIATDRAAAPDRVLLIVSCGCKVACRRKCKCHKAGLFCTAMCSSCNGQTCENSTPISDSD